MTNKGGRNIPALVFCFLYCYHTFIEQIGICASGVEYKMILDTERLFLREMKQNDFQDLAEILQNPRVATVYKGNIIKNLIMDCQSYTKYRPNETTGGIFVSWRRKEELPTGA